MKPRTSVSLKRWQKIIKRIEDITISIVFILAALPTLLLISILIKLSSKGPIFVIAKRISKSNRVVNIYKFRTMKCIASDQMPGLFRLRIGPSGHDDRLTIIGRALVKLRLDELPSLFNALFGSISIVGTLFLHPNRYEEYDQKYGILIDAKPGITGPAAMLPYSPNSGLTSDDIINAEIDYVRNWNVLLDLIIIAKTFTKGFRKR